MEFYEGLGSKLVLKHVQDMSDSEKALRYLISLCEENPKWKQQRESNLLVLEAFGGRLDHTFNNLSLLVRYTEELDRKFENFNLYMMNEVGIGVLIRPGRTRYIRSKNFESHKGVGLIPLGGPCKYVKTTGFKWNLGNVLRASSIDISLYLRTCTREITPCIWRFYKFFKRIRWRN